MKRVDWTDRVDGSAHSSSFCFRIPPQLTGENFLALPAFSPPVFFLNTDICRAAEAVFPPQTGLSGDFIIEMEASPIDVWSDRAFTRKRASFRADVVLACPRQ